MNCANIQSQRSKYKYCFKSGQMALDDQFHSYNTVAVYLCMHVETIISLLCIGESIVVQ